ncbi:amino acid ABC transporter permease [Bradyrhizobium sp. 187]|uniref:amino acid ABC transporter permease n=1 Tax=Bradyrhizobium sp. 187 TaxID=2782655 RepID=UPI001FFED011|nr:amino acid ABC transporter permease [Bradyrhizobium sp. 187]UPJ76803.1 amino acid ABC transporter permease [Bradyrhizobium sp. 187]
MQFQLANQGLQWSDSFFLLNGAINTVQMAICAATIGTVLGTVLGWIRSVSSAATTITSPFVDMLRSVPMVITLILSNSVLSILGFPTSPFWFGIAALSAWMAAVTAEVARFAFRSVPANYQRGARSLGMTYFQELRYVSIPLAYRAGLTSWIGLLLGLIKDTALASIIGYVEFMRSAQILITRTHETWLLLLGTGLFYFVICYPISRYGRYLERKVAA